MSTGNLDVRNSDQNHRPRTLCMRIDIFLLYRLLQRSTPLPFPPPAHQTKKATAPGEFTVPKVGIRQLTG